MHVVYARQHPIVVDMPRIFLGGCTPRSPATLSWRPDALKYLKEENFDGAVYVPEDENGGLSDDGFRIGANYEAQVWWEWECLDITDCIAFWIPRDIKILPGLTSNVEFGMYWRSGKVVAGAPDDAEKIRYLQMLAERGGIPWSNDLKSVMRLAIVKANSLTRHRGSGKAVD